MRRVVCWLGASPVMIVRVASQAGGQARQGISGEISCHGLVDPSKGELCAAIQGEMLLVFAVAVLASTGRYRSRDLPGGEAVWQGCQAKRRLGNTHSRYTAAPVLTFIVHSWLQAGLEAAPLRPLQAPLDLEEHPPSSQVRARVLRHVVSLPSHIYPLPFHLVQPIKPLAISLRPHTVQ